MACTNFVHSAGTTHKTPTYTLSPQVQPNTAGGQFGCWRVLQVLHPHEVHHKLIKVDSRVVGTHFSLGKSLGT